MSLPKIDLEHLRIVRVIERELIVACRLGQTEAAEKELKKIQRVLASYGSSHPRLLESRLRYFECLLDTNSCSVAESGFVGVRRKANTNTRLYLEATFLLGVSLLRQNKLIEAKKLLREVLDGFNKIKTQGTRRTLQKLVVERIEQESLLAKLIGNNEHPLDANILQDGAVALVGKSETEILEEIARALPPAAVHLLVCMRAEVILMLPPPDRLALPAPGQAASTLNLGKALGGFMKRVVWRSVCAPDSPIFKAWSAKLPDVYSVGYFATAAAATLNNFRIGLPALGIGVVAILMKSTAAEFCEVTAPTSIMETRGRADL